MSYRNDPIIKIAKSVEKKTKIKTYPKVIEDIISSIKATGNFWQVVRISQRPIPVVAETVRILEKEKLIQIYDGEIKTTEEFGELFKRIPKFQFDFTCSECDGRGINIKTIGIYDEFAEIRKKAPKPVQEYDQGNITPESTIGRISLMRIRGDVAGKKIIVLGDDDLVGIALGLTRMPDEVLVLDIDKRLIDFTNDIAKERNLPVHAEVFDLREPLPKKLKAKFDVFVTDPPEAKKPFVIFIQKGIWTLKGEGCSGYIGMTLIDSSVPKWAELQSIILKSGGAITDIIRDFNKYDIWDYHQNTVAWKLAPAKSPADSIWYTSAIVRIEIVRKANVKNEKLKLKQMYVDIESTTT
ncbi:MAG: bis-aminopropyl spermidine synthase family protein [Candidatus Calescibacterium sp.]|nr:bis-aminopropyl spermidine synthase family protein [Candidatus Calescibacterium sp.]MCX7734416.1 bis-aminopropyl spermidine synthase family protein [bacterium]MDW8086818.1 bis-aminopropyl spermidine synthase family protein [Candidatus Calescibacterium sp.]